MRTRLPPRRRRALIVEAAGRLFGEHGYDGTRLDRVAAAAGVTKPVLYRHFAGKRALYLALLERHRDDLDGFGPAIPEVGSLEERLRTVAELWVAYAHAHRYAWAMLFRDRGGGPAVEALRLEVHERAREVLVELIRATAASPIPEEQLVPLAELLSMGQASLALWWMDEPSVPRDAIVEAIVRVWHGVLA